VGRVMLPITGWLMIMMMMMITSTGALQFNMRSESQWWSSVWHIKFWFWRGKIHTGYSWSWIWHLLHWSSNSALHLDQQTPLSLHHCVQSSACSSSNCTSEDRD
jgi:hypothetical protein